MSGAELRILLTSRIPLVRPLQNELPELLSLPAGLLEDLPLGVRLVVDTQEAQAELAQVPCLEGEGSDEYMRFGITERH